jgi:hypothetical protein
VQQKEKRSEEAVDFGGEGSQGDESHLLLSFGQTKFELLHILKL